ncbi:YdbL family protein [Hirschia litorea]|uniref:YdbL family protein n=1 Tax=Hirschia litorea TaxID=1199156 RepID=A0ABW2IMG5_9PROT
MRVIAYVVLLLIANQAFVGAAIAHPQLDDAKRSGQIGERFDGYIGLVDAAGADVELKRFVDDINARRREAYTRLSEETGKSMTSIARKTAEKQIEKAQMGEFVMYDTGNWKLKQ